MSTAEKPIDRDFVNLRWMSIANNAGKGLFGPTLHRFGPVSECERLVSLGYAILVRPQRRRNEFGESGYWLTDNGRNALRPQDRVIIAQHETGAISGD